MFDKSIIEKSCSGTEDEMLGFPSLLKPIDVKLEQLLLDPNNPRFAEFDENSNQVPEIRFAEDKIKKDTYERMKEFDVSELRDNMKAVGFLPMDRIVVREWAGNKASKEIPLYVVIEGNRRVTALKWLMELNDKGRETLELDQIENFTNIPALLLDTSIAPDSVKLVLPGLRHISGIKEWGAYQKAKAVITLRETGMSTNDVAQSLGLTARAANQLWRSYLALEQMKDDDEFGNKVYPRMYSYFEEIIKQPKLKEWLGWDDNQGKFTNEQRLKEMYGWIVGETPDEDSEPVEPKLREAKSVRKLAKFIDDEKVLALFRAPDGTLSAAEAKYESIHQIDQQDWRSIIIAAETTLQSLTPDTLRKMGEEDLDMLDSLRKRIVQTEKDRQSLLKKK